MPTTTCRNCGEEIEHYPYRTPVYCDMECLSEDYEERSKGPTAPLEERFWSYVDVSSDCWRWTGPIGSDGYGRLWHGGNERAAHRFSLELSGDVLDEVVHHTCENRRCVNPDHLETMSNAEHSRMHYEEDPDRFGIQPPKDECKHGHPFNEENTYIRPNGRRDCRACTRERQRRYQRRKKEGAA